LEETSFRRTENTAAPALLKSIPGEEMARRRRKEEKEEEKERRRNGKFGKLRDKVT